MRLVGPDRGYALAGLLGGLVSSTMVTLSFSRESRRAAAPGRALGAGVAAACTILLVLSRVGVLATILYPAVGWRVWPYLLLPLAAGLGLSAAIRRWETGRHRARPCRGNPLRLGAAIQMALAFQAVLYVVEWVRRWFGSPGVLLSAAGLGLTDVDALTYAMTRFPADGVDTATAAQALAVGVLANTVLKLVLVLVVGRGTFRRVAGFGLAGLAVASLAALLGLRPGPCVLERSVALAGERVYPVLSRAADLASIGSGGRRTKSTSPTRPAPDIAISDDTDERARAIQHRQVTHLPAATSARPPRGTCRCHRWPRRPGS